MPHSSVGRALSQDSFFRGICYAHLEHTALQHVGGGIKGHRLPLRVHLALASNGERKIYTNTNWFIFFWGSTQRKKELLCWFIPEPMGVLPQHLITFYRGEWYVEGKHSDTDSTDLCWGQCSHTLAGEQAWKFSCPSQGVCICLPCTFCTDLSAASTMQAPSLEASCVWAWRWHVPDTSNVMPHFMLSGILP